ncbi:glycosyltransferase [Candidatus Parcubacteria bacterium]|nr:MAG: glycosyltransferase [Candidatus Parcubacteria bacterium]
MYIISEFGTQEAQRMGIDASHLEVCVDTHAWRQRTPEDRANLRQAYGYQEDDFIILTVADNQERKNLAGALEIFRDFARDKPNARYVLVTRVGNRVGWKLLDLINDFGIADKVRLVERGLPFPELWGLYAMSDVFLLCAKAEGAGLPLLEAMSVGIPCVGTDWAAIHEHLRDGRGYLVPTEYEFIDPFGNGLRKFISKQEAVRTLDEIYANGVDDAMLQKARNYVEARRWPVVVSEFEKTLRELVEHG